MSSSQSSLQGETPENIDVAATLSVNARPPDTGDPPSLPIVAWRKDKPDELIKKLQLTKAKSLETRHNFAARSDPFFSYSIKRTDWENDEEHFNAMRNFLNDTMSVSQKRLFENNITNFNKDVLREFLVEKTEMYEGRLAFQLTGNSQTELLDQIWSIGKARDPLLKVAKQEYRTLREEMSSAPTKDAAPKAGDEAPKSSNEISDLNKRFLDARKRVHWLGCLSLTISGSKILILPFEVPKEDLNEWTVFIRTFMSQDFERNVFPNPENNLTSEKLTLKFQELNKKYDHLLLCSILGRVEKGMIAEEVAETHFGSTAGMKLVGEVTPGILPSGYQEDATDGESKHIRLDFICTITGETTPTQKSFFYGQSPSHFTNLKIISQCSHCSHCNTMKHTRFHCKLALCKRCRTNHQGKSCREFKAERAAMRSTTPPPPAAKRPRVEQTAWQTTGPAKAAKSGDTPKTPVQNPRNMFEILQMETDAREDAGDDYCTLASYIAPAQAEFLARHIRTPMRSIPQPTPLTGVTAPTTPSRLIVSPKTPTRSRAKTTPISKKKSDTRVAGSMVTRLMTAHFRQQSNPTLLTPAQQKARDRVQELNAHFSQEIYHSTKDELGQKYLVTNRDAPAISEPQTPAPPDRVDATRDYIDELLDPDPRTEDTLNPHTVQVGDHEMTTSDDMTLQAQTAGQEADDLNTRSLERNSIVAGPESL